MVLWKEVHNQHPFGILEVSRVGLGEFGHSPILPDYLRNALLGSNWLKRHAAEDHRWHVLNDEHDPAPNGCSVN